MAAGLINWASSSIESTIAATKTESSCSPQANSQPPPPRAHAPNPTRVNCKSELPSFRVSITDLAAQHCGAVNFYFVLDELCQRKVRKVMRKIVDEISVVANGQEAGAQRAAPLP